MKMLLKLNLLFLFLFISFMIMQNQVEIAFAQNRGVEIASKITEEELLEPYDNSEKLSVTIVAGKESPRTIKTGARLVSDVLEELTIEITDDDRVFPSPNTAVIDNMKIEITFVEQKIFTEKAVMEFPTVSKKDPGMPAGSKIIIQPGKEGIVKNTIRIWYKNGEETARGVISQEIIVPPVEEVAIVGTKTDIDKNLMASRGLSAASKFTIVDVVEMEASAYEPGPISCGIYADGYTYTGIKAGYGVAAVDPSFIPLGTPLYIEGYGYAIAADRGGAIVYNRIDLCYDTYQEAIMFGRRTVKVYILKNK